MRLGRLNLHLANDGGFRLDGGAMFGVVPKVLWERQRPADERNRIAEMIRYDSASAGSPACPTG